MTSFTRLLADYRACVYETYFLEAAPSIALMNESTKSGILVIEDNTDQWFLTRWALLQRFPQVQLQWLRNDSDVMPYLDACRQQEEDLPRMILVDLYLPSAQQGLAILLALKSHPVYKPIPTLALSWSNRTEDVTQVFNHLADGYLVKPIGYQDWLTELSLLDRYLN